MGLIANPSANFTRPSDTTAYASGDLVANSTTAGSVTPLSWSTTWWNFRIKRCVLVRSQATATNASFRLHLFSATTTATNGDNGVFAPATSSAIWLGFLDLPVALGYAFTNIGVNLGYVLDNAGNYSHEMGIALAAPTLYGLIEAKAAYTPASAETFTVNLEIEQTG